MAVGLRNPSLFPVGLTFVLWWAAGSHSGGRAERWNTFLFAHPAAGNAR